MQDSNVPQTPPDIGSPTTRYKTVKQTLETADQDPFSPRRTKDAARIRKNP